MSLSKKILYVATVDSHIEFFHLPHLKLLKDMGYEVHVATNTSKQIKYCDKKDKLKNILIELKQKKNKNTNQNKEANIPQNNI